MWIYCTIRMYNKEVKETQILMQVTLFTHCIPFVMTKIKTMFEMVACCQHKWIGRYLQFWVIILLELYIELSSYQSVLLDLIYVLGRRIKDRLTNFLLIYSVDVSSVLNLFNHGKFLFKNILILISVIRKNGSVFIIFYQ